jgi:hypothetical protein
VILRALLYSEVRILGDPGNECFEYVFQRLHVVSLWHGVDASTVYPFEVSRGDEFEPLCDSRVGLACLSRIKS